MQVERTVQIRINEPSEALMRTLELSTEAYQDALTVGFDCKTRCGCRSKEGRHTRGEFVCPECGLHIHADINAGKNICQRGNSLARANSQTSECSEETHGQTPALVVGALWSGN